MTRSMHWPVAACRRVPCPRGALLRKLLLGALLAAVTTAVAASPEVRRVAIASSPGPDLTYSAGDRIGVTVQFDREVDVTGTPRLVIDIGRNARSAPMWMHSGSRLHFGYDVDAADFDADGIGVGEQALRLDGARIAAGGESADVSLGRHAIHRDPAHKVDGPGRRRPRVASVHISSDPGPDETYAIGDELEVTVQFDEGVTANGEPGVALRLGDADRRAGYRRGSGTSRLVFAYAVAAGDAAESGVSLPANGLAGGDIRDADGNAPVPDYDGLAAQPGHRVDGIAPRATAVRLVSTPRSGRTYARNETLLIEVTFDDAVDWAEQDAAMWIRVGDRLRAARAVGRRSRTVVFGYLVRAGDSASEIEAGSDGELSPDWSGIRDAAGNAAAPRFEGAGTAFEAELDGSVDDTAPPRIQMVSIVSRPRAGNVYRRGERIAVYVSFNEPMRPVSPDPVDRRVTLGLTIGNRDVTVRGSMDKDGRGAHFPYIVAGADVDPDGISVPGPFGVGSAAGAEDGEGNRIAGRSLRFAEVAGPEHTVDGRLDDLPPRLLRGYLAASRDRDGVLRTGSILLVALEFSGLVEALGSLGIDVGGERRAAPFAERSGDRFGATGTVVRFAYVVAEGDLGPRGFSLAADGWRDAAFRDRDRRAFAVRPFGLAYTRFPVSGKAMDTAARVTGFTLSPPAAGDAYRAGEVIRAAIEFDDRVSADPATALTLGGPPLPCEVDGGGLRLVCERTVGAGEAGRRVAVAAAAVEPADAVRDALGNVVDTDLAAYLGDIPPLAVDGTPPAVTRLVLASRPLAGGTYGAGARIEVVVQFSEAIRVDGSPELALVVGDGDGAVRLARLERASGASGLRFRYVVRAGDIDASGVSIPAGAIRLNGGAITDLAGNPALLAHAALTHRRRHRVDGSVLDDSGTPPQIWIAREPAAAIGSPAAAAAASLIWEMRSTWSDQPSEIYRITTDRPDVRIGRARGRVAPNQRVVNTLALPCPSHGAVHARLTISVGEATAPVAWDVLCRYGRATVAGMEFFQGPLAARFDARGSPTSFVDTVSGRPGVLRFHLLHRGAAVPEVGVSATGVGRRPDLRVDYTGTRSGEGGLESAFVARLPDGSIGSRGGFRIAIDPEDRLDDDAVDAAADYLALGPRLMPRFRLVLIPIEVERIEAGAGHDWLTPAGMARQERGLRSLYPIAATSVRVGAPLSYTMSDDERAAGQVDLLSVFWRVLEHWNRNAAPDEYYAGWYSLPGLLDAGIGVRPYGVAVVGGAASVGEIYHEIGHNFGLRHIPNACGEGADGGDQGFPYDDGGTGPHPAWIPAEERFITPADGYHDIMACRSPAYISDYNYDKAAAWGDHVRERQFRNRARAAAGAEESRAAPLDVGHAPPRSLALSGAVDYHGVWSLYSSAASARPPRNDAPGDFTIALFDDAGVELHRQRLAVEAVSHAAVRVWAARMPIQPRAVRAVRVRGPGGDLLLDAPVALPAGGPPQPLH